MSAIDEFYKSLLILHFLANSAHLSLGWPAESKKYSIGKLGYASVREESSKKWNSTTAEVARG